MTSLSVLLYGRPGSGKTFSLPTALLAEGAEALLYLGLDPGGEAALWKSAEAHKVREKVHVALRPPSVATEGDLRTMISTLATRSLEDILRRPPTSGRREAEKRAREIVDLLENFKCDCCNREWGPISSTPPSISFAIDSLSGLNDIALALVSGLSPVRSQPQWGAAIEFERQLISNILRTKRGLFILIAHAERETDELSGAAEVAPGALGRKLPQTIGREFSEVVLAERDGRKFKWSTIPSRAMAKARVLPLEGELAPSFEPLMRFVLSTPTQKGA